MARSMGGGGRSSSGGHIGGGRSMGGGGRSVSRSFSGSGRSHTSGSSGVRHVGGVNSFGGSNHSSNYRHNNYNQHHHYSHGGPGMPPPPRYYNGYRARSSSSMGFGSLFIILLFFFMIVIVATLGSSSGKKLNKEKYTGAVCAEHGYYLDASDPAKGGFIDSSNERILIDGMKNFYERTGVFPYLYIVESTNGVNPQEFSEIVYENTFVDKSGKVIEGNLLILYVADQQNGTGDYFLSGGLNIGATIDAAATDEICNQINKRWDSGDLGKIIGEGMNAASKNIMAKSNSTKITITLIISIAVIIVISILFSWWKKRVAQKNKEQQDLENILSTPLQSFGTTPMDDLTSKYDNNSNNGQ